VTLANPEVVQLLNNSFIPTFFNFERPQLDAEPLPAMNLAPSERCTNQLPDGYGTGQVAVFICTPDGRILHRLDGFVQTATLLRESHWALGLFRINEETPNSIIANELIRTVVSAREADLKDEFLRQHETALVLEFSYLSQAAASLTSRYLLARVEPYLLGVFDTKTSDPER
jgi:hypothetical protein